MPGWQHLFGFRLERGDHFPRAIEVSLFTVDSGPHTEGHVDHVVVARAFRLCKGAFGVGLSFGKTTKFGQNPREVVEDHRRNRFITSASATDRDRFAIKTLGVKWLS